MFIRSCFFDHGFLYTQRNPLLFLLSDQYRDDSRSRLKYLVLEVSWDHRLILKSHMGISNVKNFGSISVQIFMFSQHSNKATGA